MSWKSYFKQSPAKISINFQRPDFIDTQVQGNRGPFNPVLMGLQYLVALNKWQLAQKDYPLLYNSGIYYWTKPPAVEWHDIPSLLIEGKGDCKDLVAYRAAELSHYYGVETKPLIKWKWTKILKDKDSRGNPCKPYWAKCLLVHVILQWPSGYIEDPSKILGMGGEYQ
jgi:hypothetical protein